MSPVTPQLRRLYATTLPFGIACGISIGLTAVHLNRVGYSKDSIGFLALFFGAGLVLFALPVGAIIRRFSAERVLAASLIGYAGCLAAFPHAHTFASVAGVRFIDGLFTIGIWVSSETVLLAQARKEHKAYLTTLYAIWLASGYVAGPLMATGMDRFVPATVSFGVAALFALGAGLYVALKMPPAPPVEGASTDEETPGEKNSELSAATILWRIKTSCFASFSYGYFQAAVVIFLPLYLIESKGIPENRTIVLPGLFCLGMMIFSNVAGRVADRVGHLLAVRVLSFIGLLCVLGFVYADNYWLMLAIVFGSGGSFASMSPIALALTGVIVEPRDYGRANSIYNMFYAAGILSGPLVASQIFQRFGGMAMLYHHVAMWAVFVLFTVAFMYDDPAARRRRDPKDADDADPTGLPGGAAG
ncbi:MFS transporter [Polyangium sorediatum]|uniref:MFS transporter n=1 Tax=Polyangium sorediatum TaxID=889274 RepID=A0ABT6NX62_9BACT|nr:MFS transporter [Polyangium sorediatum]MDI1432904.1 MFS transporter [Polyangium sorediatum]